MNRNFIILLSVALLLLAACGDKGGEQKSDPQSEAMLSGVWVNEDDESIAFKAVGDTLYYIEANALPVHFRIYGDTIYLDGVSPMRYFIEKLSENVFQFRNQNGESVRLVKSDNPDAENDFGSDGEFFDDEINQQLVKRDTVVMNGDTRYHCYIQVNPTTYKVYKTDYSDEGVGVSRVYYDNIINLTVYEGANRLFSSDIQKQDFLSYVPEEVMCQSILSDVVYDRCDESGVVFRAILRIPESAAGYLVFITISPTGGKTLSQPE